MAATTILANAAVSTSDSTKLQALNSVAGRSAVLIGPTVTGYETINATMFAVGGTDGAISVANNQEIVKLQSSALQNPYAVLPTAYDFQVNFTMQEIDIPNIALALSLKHGDAQVVAPTVPVQSDLEGIDPVGAPDDLPRLSVLQTWTVDVAAGEGADTGEVTSSAVHGLVVGDVLKIKGIGTDNAAMGVTVLTVDSTTTFSISSDAVVVGNDEVVYKSVWRKMFDLDPANPSPYRSMRIVTLAPRQSEDTVAYFGWDFFKVKIVSQGTIDFDRTANVQLPVTAHCLGNDNDVVGRLWHTDTLTDRGYPS